MLCQHEESILIQFRVERVKIGWNEDKSDHREQGVLVVVQVGKNAKEGDGFYG